MSTCLPPEVLDQIYTEAVQSYKTSVEKDRNYSSFSLVCKNWSGVASRKLLESLKIRNGTHMRLVLKEIERSGLGHLVKKLEVVFYSSELDKQEHPKDISIYEPFSIAQVKQEGMVEMDDFIRLAKLLPNLTRLVLSPPSFIRFRRRDLHDLSIFPNVTYLHFTASYRHNELEVLKGLLILAPRVDYLLMDGSSGLSESIKPLDHSLVSLRTLIFKNHNIQRIAAGRDAAGPVFPMSSYKGIETLLLAEFDPSEPGDDQILEVAGPTLKSLTVDYINHSDIFVILPLIPSTTKILSFKHPYHELVEESFFQHLPLCLRTLKQPAISTDLLQHYNNNQREGFQLKEIMIAEATKELIQLLPSTISRITVTNLNMVSNLLSVLQSLQLTSSIPDSLQVVQFFSQPKVENYLHDPPLEDFPFDLVQDFKTLGIILQEPIDDIEYE